MRDDALVFLSGARVRIVTQLPFIGERWYRWVFDPYIKTMSWVTPSLQVSTAEKEVFDHTRNIKRDVTHAFSRFQHFYQQIYPGENLTACPVALPARKVENFVLLNIGASNKLRRWPVSEFTWVARQVLNRGIDVVFLGGPDERSLRQSFNAIAQRLRCEFPLRRAPVVIDQLDFSEVIELVQSALCYVGADTGAAHLAMWLSTATITILQSDPSTDLYHHVGDFFPYPYGLLNTYYQAVWATPEEFHVRNGSPGVAKKVWEAIDETLGHVLQS
jgi:ADP-heptose:LPS heptosyltransferase